MNNLQPELTSVKARNGRVVSAALVPFFYFRVLDDLDSPDDEGAVLRDLDDARRHGIRAARGLMCETLTRHGRITLGHRIIIEDDNHQPVATVSFHDAIKIEGEKNGGKPGD